MFETNGFLTGDFGDTAVKGPVTPEQQKWVDHAEQINRLGMSVLYALKPSNKDFKQIACTLAYGRCLQSYQAAILLAKLGMPADSRAIIRGCLETTIILENLAKDEAFYEKLIERHDKHHIALRSALLNDADAKAHISNADMEKIKRTRDELTQKYGPDKPKDVNLADIARDVDLLPLYNMIYRPTSGDAGHATVDALSRHLKVNPDGTIKEYSFAPEISEIAIITSNALHAFTPALHRVITLFNLTQFNKVFEECVTIWTGLGPP